MKALRIIACLLAAAMLSSCTAAILYAAARPEIKARKEREKAAKIIRRAQRDAE